MNDAAAVVDLALGLVRRGEWSIGIGVGPVHEPLPASTRAGSGPAFELARKAVERAKSSPQLLAVEASDAGRAAAAQAALDLLASVVQRRSEPGWQAVDLISKGTTQTEVAEALGITKQAVSQRLRAATWAPEVAGRDLAAQLLAAADSPSSTASVRAPTPQNPWSTPTGSACTESQDREHPRRSSSCCSPRWPRRWPWRCAGRPRPDRPPGRAGSSAAGRVRDPRGLRRPGRRLAAGCGLRAGCRAATTAGSDVVRATFRVDPRRAAPPVAPASRDDADVIPMPTQRRRGPRRRGSRRRHRCPSRQRPRALATRDRVADRCGVPRPTSRRSRRVRGTVLRGGAWIGYLERAAISATLLAGWPEGMALVLAVKGVGRYPELRGPDVGGVARARDVHHRHAGQRALGSRVRRHRRARSSSL